VVVALLEHDHVEPASASTRAAAAPPAPDPTTTTSQSSTSPTGRLHRCSIEVRRQQRGVRPAAELTPWAGAHQRLDLIAARIWRQQSVFSSSTRLRRSIDPLVSNRSMTSARRSIVSREKRLGNVERSSAEVARRATARVRAGALCSSRMASSTTRTPPSASAAGRTPPGGISAWANARSVSRSGARRPRASLQTGARASRTLAESIQQPSATPTRLPSTTKFAR